MRSTADPYQDLDRVYAWALDGADAAEIAELLDWSVDRVKKALALGQVTELPAAVEYNTRKYAEARQDYTRARAALYRSQFNNAVAAREVSSARKRMDEAVGLDSATKAQAAAMDANKGRELALLMAKAVLDD